jgi:Protein of unknown function (DUF4058)
MLDLQPLLHQIYDRALAIDYQQQPLPKLPLEDWGWVGEAILLGRGCANG